MLVNLPKAPIMDCTGLPESTTSSKLARTFPKNQMLKRPSTSGTTGSGKAVKKRRVEPSEMSGMKLVEDRPIAEDDLKGVEKKARLATLHKEEEMSKMAVRLINGICLGVEEERAELKRKKVELERNVGRLKNDLLKERKRMETLMASQVVEINNLHAEARTNLKEVVAEHDRLGRHIVSKGFSEDEVDAIKADTYVEEEGDEEIEDVVVGIVNGLDSISPQMVRDNQGDDNERPKGETEKIELQSARLHEDDARQCNQEFTEEFDRMREANEDREDQHVKVHFKLVEATQTAVDLARQIEEKDAEIDKGQNEFTKLKEHAAKLKSQNNMLMVKSREADMACYRIQALERSEEGLNRSATDLKNDLIKTNNN
ncbi:hypothetical protein GIB67_040049 [Kingdonia uniflora]|uniref:Uncharacterized protein n=1 Tax=Kingdonia uniflora TaxID=39325 RepID=A0A7J7MUF6_9MAGN|nr:hypothetical protein GIB67_040049 [Kingdonia uniflora]